VFRDFVCARGPLALLMHVASSIVLERARSA
jgi:hypothetical protein